MSSSEVPRRAPGRRPFTLLLAALALGLAAPLPAQDRGEGPASLFLVYKCKPEKRAGFRAHIAGPGVNQFEQWKKEKVFGDYFILFTSYVNDYSWDMLVRLDFDAYVDTEKWKAVERIHPAGLSPEGLALCSPTRSYLMDLAFQKASPSRNPARSVYMLMPYFWATTHPRPKELYKNYFSTKAKKEYDAWVSEGTVSWYGVYMNHHPYGKAWNMLFLIEYRDPAALARRKIVTQEVQRQKFVGVDDGWAFAREFVDMLGSEEDVILADPILPR